MINFLKIGYLVLQINCRKARLDFMKFLIYMVFLISIFCELRLAQDFSNYANVGRWIII